MVDWLIEIVSYSEMEERRGKGINRLVKTILVRTEFGIGTESKGKVCKGRRKVVYRVVKVMP